MKVTATVEFPNWDGVSVEGEIIAEAARQILEEAGEKIVSAARNEVMTQIRAEIAEIIQDVIAAPVQPTNRYGDPRGDPVSLKELMLDESRKWLAERVDPRNGSSRSYGDTIARSEYLFRRAIRIEMTTAYKTKINEAVLKVKAELDDSINEMVSEAVKSILGLS